MSTEITRKWQKYDFCATENSVRYLSTKGSEPQRQSGNNPTCPPMMQISYTLLNSKKQHGLHKNIWRTADMQGSSRTQMHCKRGKAYNTNTKQMRRGSFIQWNQWTLRAFRGWIPLSTSILHTSITTPSFPSRAIQWPLKSASDVCPSAKATQDSKRVSNSLSVLKSGLCDLVGETSHFSGIAKHAGVLLCFTTSEFWWTSDISVGHFKVLVLKARCPVRSLISWSLSGDNILGLFLGNNGAARSILRFLILK